MLSSGRRRAPRSRRGRADVAITLNSYAAIAMAALLAAAAACERFADPALYRGPVRCRPARGHPAAVVHDSIHLSHVTVQRMHFHHRAANTTWKRSATIGIRMT